MRAVVDQTGLRELKAPTDIFKETDEGTWEGSANIKGQYSNRVVPVPDQFDADANLLPKDFQLTSGSTVNIMVEFVPYAMTKENYGVSLRLRQVQVTKLAERQSYNPFKKVEGGFVAGKETHTILWRTSRNRRRYGRCQGTREGR